MAKRRAYSEEEDAYIRQHYASTPHRDIADQLGRSVKSIRRRSEKIGCPRAKRCRRFTEEEDQLILASKGRPLTDVAAELGRDPSDLLKHAHRLGFASWRRPDGGRYVDKRGYEVRRFDHGKPIYEHRAVVEEIIGRRLTADERVHHIDTDKRNNSAENLFLFAGPADHVKCHASLNKITKPGDDVAELLRMGRISFDKTGGVYKCGRQML